MKTERWRGLPRITQLVRDGGRDGAGDGNEDPGVPLPHTALFSTPSV